MAKNKIIFRADGNSLIGLGHVIRVLALIEMLKDSFECVLAISAPDEFILKQVARLNIALISLPETTYSLPDSKKQEEEIEFDLAQYLTGTEIVVTDGYWFGINYQRSIKESGCYLICIDDSAERYFVADAVINHAPGLSPQIYKKDKNTKLYLGLDYLLLRTEFYLPETTWPQQNSIFVSLGGSDHFNLTITLIKLIRDAQPAARIEAMLSSSFSQSTKDELHTLAANDGNIILHSNISAEEIVNIIDRSTHCVVAASTVLLECFARRKRAYSGYYAENQQNIYNGMLRLNYISGAGNLLNLQKHAIDLLEEYLHTGSNILEAGITGVRERYIKIFQDATGTFASR